MIRSTSLVLALLTLVACSSSAADADSDTATIAKSCTKSSCDQRMEDDHTACSRCMDACFGASYDCDSSSACKASCGSSRPCNDSERKTCVEEGFTLALPEHADAALETACESVVARAHSCSWQIGTINCTTNAHTERLELVDAYSCIAALPCDTTDEALQACQPAATDFGDKFCAAMSEHCSDFCDSDLRNALNHEGGWLKDSLIAAAMTCAGQDTCGDARDCFEAWVTGAF